MALDTTVLSDRWGDIFGGINETNTFAGTTIASRANNIAAGYTTLGGQGEVIDELYTSAISIRSSLAEWNDYLFGLIESTLQTMCRDDSARPRTDDLVGWFDKLNRDMVAADRKWTIPAVTATAAVPTTNVGTGFVIASVIDPVDGLATYYAYSEVIRLECTADSYSGTATAGRETFSVSGETQVGLRDYNWPKGSGAATTLTVVDTATDVCLTDGGLENWNGSTNVPTSWSLVGGTVAGTHLHKETSTSGSGAIYTDGGAAAAKFSGDGTAVVGLSQTLDQTVIKSSTNYAISFWYKTTSATYTAKLRVALVNSSGTVVTDNHPVTPASQDSTSAGATYQVTGGSYTVSGGGIDETALGAANGAWARATVVLRTPRNLPTGLALEFRFPTGDVLDSGKSVYLDHVIMSEMEQAYDGGPYLAVHSGATDFALRDAFTLTVANDKTTTNFVRCLDRTFALAREGIRLTVTGTTALADSKITDD